jgi:hypothetical protein
MLTLYLYYRDVQFVASTSKEITVENDAAEKDYIDVDSSETFSDEVDNIDEDGLKGLLGITSSFSRNKILNNKTSLL